MRPTCYVPKTPLKSELYILLPKKNNNPAVNVGHTLR